MTEFSTENISSDLIKEITQVIAGKRYGSVEIFIEDGKVTHITERTIRKYNSKLKPLLIEKKLKTTVSLI